MPNIQLTDQLGFTVDAEIDPDSTIAKYIKGLAKLKFPKLNLASLKDLPLDEAPLKKLQTGMEFEQPVDIGVDGSEMKIGAGASGILSLLSAAEEQLFDSEVFGDPISIGPNQFYLGVGTAASLSSELTHEAGDLSFRHGRDERSQLFGQILSRIFVRLAPPAGGDAPTDHDQRSPGIFVA